MGIIISVFIAGKCGWGAFLSVFIVPQSVQHGKPFYGLLLHSRKIFPIPGADTDARRGASPCRYVVALLGCLGEDVAHRIASGLHEQENGPVVAQFHPRLHGFGILHRVAPAAIFRDIHLDHGKTIGRAEDAKEKLRREPVKPVPATGGADWSGPKDFWPLMLPTHCGWGQPRSGREPHFGVRVQPDSACATAAAAPGVAAVAHYLLHNKWESP